jgi:ankyrin repeat protein
MQDHNRVMTVLLREGANVDAMVKDGLTPLIYAAGNGRDAMVYILLETGADVNKAADDWCTALHGAAFSGSETELAALLRAGASVNPRVLDNGWSPLFFAVQKDHDAVVLVLLGAGANPDTTVQYVRLFVFLGTGTTP